MRPRSSCWLSKREQPRHPKRKRKPPSVFLGASNVNGFRSGSNVTTRRVPQVRSWYMNLGVGVSGLNLRYAFMNAAENMTAKKLADLGVIEPDQLAPLFAQVRSRFDSESTRVHSEESWKLFRDAWLGRKSGVLTQITDNWLKPAGPALKPAVGAALNQLRAHLERKIDALQSIIDSGGGEEAASTRDRVDLSLPGVIRPVGSRHLIRQVFQEIEDIFFSIGFSVAEGPAIETPYYNFEALNIPEFHPVRDDMDTFYIDVPSVTGKQSGSSLLLRTHTSPVQIRTMEKTRTPVPVIVRVKVYRRDNPDATHSFMFHQIEGLAVDSDITFCDFTGTIEYFVKQFFGPGVKTRFRPSYFPFTEPSKEPDASCVFCNC